VSLIEIKVPPVGESISEVTLSKWLKADGDYAERDEILCELESDKATFELNAEKAGKIKILVAEKSTLKIGDAVCSIDTDAPAPAKKTTPEKEPVAAPAPKQAPAAPADKSLANAIPSPAAAKMMQEQGVSLNAGTGKGGRITKADVLLALKNKTNPAPANSRQERREKMSSLRKTVSKHLVKAKNETAMLTTFNEVDMKPIMEMRARFKEAFKTTHGVNLGFMSFFAKACCFALQEFPAVNAMIDNEELVYHDYCDLSIAVSTPKGLVVPVIRNAESLSFAGIEKKVADLAARGRDNKLTLEEMSGGTFTITNGGVFGSLMSTPIINIPQSAILGMHKIQERPMAVDGQVVIRPMMYLALSYDHRIIDGKESVSFLVRVKEMLEHPDQLLLGADVGKVMLEL